MTIHVGLIGGGNISGTHARAARAIAGVEIAAIYGTNTSKVSVLCQEYGKYVGVKTGTFRGGCGSLLATLRRSWQTRSLTP